MIEKVQDQLTDGKKVKRIYTRMPYTPRPQQREIHAILDSCRFPVLVAHRRFGKTILSVNQIIRRACKDGLLNGRYAYVAPFRNQAKQIAWSYLKKYTSPLMGRRINEQELSVTLPGDIVIRVFGADNPDSLRGLYFDGLVIDEVAQIKREVWHEILRPALADREGWAIFIGTPKGENLFHEMYLKALADQTGEWSAMVYRVDQTDALPADEVEKVKKEMSDSAFRQEFMCDFSASTEDSLITLEEASQASKRNYAPSNYMSMPLVFGVDVARFGTDRSVVFMRRGLKAEQPTVITKADNVTVANRIISLNHQFKPRYIFVDAGQGQGVIDILRQSLNNVVEVPFGGSALDSARYVNRRTEMWYLLREWIKAGGQIPDTPELVSELSAPMYDFTVKGKIALEEKKKIKERIGKSPDLADALALTFALPVMPEGIGGYQQFAETNVDPFQQYADGFASTLIPPGGSLFIFN